MGATVSSPDQRFLVKEIQPWKPRFQETPLRHPEAPPLRHHQETPLVTEIQTKNQWRARFNALKNTNKLLVIDFTAKWCGPCKLLDPKIKEFAAKYTDVEFVKIDVDVLMSLSMDFGVYTLPAVLLMKRGEELDRVVGLKVDELQNKIDKYRQPLC